MNTADPSESRVVLITGAARRIGAAMVEYFHQAGYRVIIHCNHSIQSAHLLSEKLNRHRTNSAHVIRCDLVEPKAPEQLIAASYQCYERLDILVNNASMFTKTDWDLLFKINVEVPYQLSLLAADALSQTKGAIINITDIHAEVPLKEYAIYSQTKAALNAQTKALARELAPDIRVNAIAPGAIVWPEGNNTLSATLQNDIIQKTALKRHGHPLYIAQMAHAIAENPYITGQIIRVDGGRY